MFKDSVLTYLNKGMKGGTRNSIGIRGISMSFIYIISLNLKTFLQDKYTPILLMRTQDKEKLTLAQSYTTIKWHSWPILFLLNKC